MSDNSNAPTVSHGLVGPANESVTERIARAYNMSRVAPSQSLVASDFRLNLSTDQRLALEQEREAIRARVFADL